MPEPTLDDARALSAAGADAYRRGEIRQAKRLFEDAAAAATGDVRLGAMVNAASMADQLGEHAAALAGYRRALAEIPEDAARMRASTLVNMSQAWQHLGALDDAQRALEQARALLADNTDADLGELRVACLLSLTAVALHRQNWAYAVEIATESIDAAMLFAPGLAGHPLLNLAAAYFETGRHDLAVDFARQALAAFESTGDRNAVAETQQNLATMLVRLGRPDEADEPLRASQAYFEPAGLAHRAGIGLKTLGFLAERRDDLAAAHDYYRRALARFTESQAVLDAADVRIRLATAVFQTGRQADGEKLLAEAFAAYAQRGLGLYCAQLDFWHATLLEARLTAAPDPETLSRAVQLAVPAALTIDAVRCTLPNGSQREQWNRQVAEPAMRLAFRLAYLSGNGLLLADLIETQCAGTTLHIEHSSDARPVRLPYTLLDPPGEFAEHPGTAVLQLGAALAGVAADAGLPVAAPPRLALAAEGRIALEGFIAVAEQRYGRKIRDDRVLTV